MYTYTCICTYIYTYIYIYIYTFVYIYIHILYIYIYVYICAYVYIHIYIYIIHINIYTTSQIQCVHHVSSFLSLSLSIYILYVHIYHSSDTHIQMCTPRLLLICVCHFLDAHIDYQKFLVAHKERRGRHADASDGLVQRPRSQSPLHFGIRKMYQIPWKNNCLVNWIQLRICVRSRNAQLHPNSPFSGPYSTLVLQYHFMDACIAMRTSILLRRRVSHVSNAYIKMRGSLMLKRNRSVL